MIKLLNKKNQIKQRVATRLISWLNMWLNNDYAPYPFVTYNNVPCQNLENYMMGFVITCSRIDTNLEKIIRELAQNDELNRNVQQHMKNGLIQYSFADSLSGGGKYLIFVKSQVKVYDANSYDSKSKSMINTRLLQITKPSEDMMNALNEVHRHLSVIINVLSLVDDRTNKPTKLKIGVIKPFNQLWHTSNCPIDKTDEEYINDHALDQVIE